MAVVDFNDPDVQRRFAEAMRKFQAMSPEEQYAVLFPLSGLYDLRDRQRWLHGSTSSVPSA